MRLVKWALVLFLAIVFTAPLNAQTSKPAKSSEKSASNSNGGLQSTLEKIEHDGWEAYKKKDKKAYGDLLTDDFVGSFADGQPPHDKNSALASMDQVTLNNYSLSNFKVKTISPDAALLTCDADVTLTVGNGKPETSKLYVSDLYVKRGGAWKSMHYQETEHK
jgi:uncharacterized protein (TIGR02246 family)